MKIISRLPPDPVELAAEDAWHMALAEFDLDINPGELSTLNDLAAAAVDLGFSGSRYRLSASRGIALPPFSGRNKPEWRANFFDFEFEGHYFAYSKLALKGLTAAHETISALCLAFDEVRLLHPAFDTLPEPHVLHVPVLGVEQITTQAK